MSVIAALGFGLLLAASISLASHLAADQSLAWLLIASICWLVVLGHCAARLHLNFNPQLDSTINIRLRSLAPALGPANRLTLLRGLLIAAVAGFLAIEDLAQLPLLQFLPALLYSLAAAGDALDGHLARSRDQTSQLGKELDTELDALGLLVAPLLAVMTAKLHPSFLLVSLAYYLFRWGIAWRRRHDKAVYPLPPSRLRRQLAGWQMALVAVALWPPVPDELTRVLGVLFMIPVLAGFLVDWLAVSGRCQSNAGSQ